jgi:metal-responsive CopG/Arc/MetJ family transcriptional regulator
MPHVKTAISLDESLFEEVEALARKMGISRSQLFAKAVEDFIRRRENEELLERLNAAHADGLDKEEREYMERMREYRAWMLEREEQ